MCLHESIRVHGLMYMSVSRCIDVYRGICVYMSVSRYIEVMCILECIEVYQGICVYLSVSRNMCILECIKVNRPRMEILGNTPPLSPLPTPFSLISSHYCKHVEPTLSSSYQTANI